MTSPTYQTTHQAGNSRAGQLHLTKSNLPPITTPRVLPWTMLINGSTIYGGGCRKRVIFNLVKHGQPIISSALSFLDIDFTPRHLRKARAQTVKDWFSLKDIQFDSPLFLDSGGYQYLFNTQLDLSGYGIHKETAVSDIFSLQSDWGADIITSLDYPIPRNLVRAEALERIELNLKNAIHIAELIDAAPAKPFLYIYCHGQTPSDLESYIVRVFDRVGDILPSFGLALNSFYFGRFYDASHLCDMLAAAVRSVPDTRRAVTPIHTFGVPYGSAPFLAYLGSDSFENVHHYYSSITFNYIVPDTEKKVKIDRIDRIDCSCRYCQGLTAEQVLATYSDKKRNQATDTGLHRIECYARIALHNFEMMARFTEQIRHGIIAGEPLESLLAYADGRTNINAELDWLANNDEQFANRYARTVSKPISNDVQLTLFDDPKPVINTVSLNYTPNSFRLPDNYSPPTDKCVLLILPCSQAKPYSSSRIYNTVNNRLQSEFGSRWSRIHQVTLSGLYGPVPQEFESDPRVLNYDFMFNRANHGQFDLLIERLVGYITTYSNYYELCVGYTLFNFYRKVYNESVKQCPSLNLIPSGLGARFAYGTYIEELVEILKDAPSLDPIFS